MAQQRFGGPVATGVRKWERKVTRRTWERDGRRFQADDYSIRIAHGGRREWVNLRTSDQREAARRAARFHVTLKASGWDHAFATLGPEEKRVRDVRSGVTVGDIIREAARVALHVKPVSLRQYGSSLRWVAAHVEGLTEGRERYDGHHGGAEKWREKVDAVPVAKLTTKAIEAATIRYRQARDNAPEAARTVASFVRQARALFSRRMLRLLPFEGLVDPFEGVMIEKPRAPKYVPTFNVEALVEAARRELADTDSQVWLAFLLCLGGGLRKGEADSLLWSNVDTVRGALRIVSGKTADSVGEVPIGPEVAAELARARPHATGLFVLTAEESPKPSKNLRQYRATETWERLTAWLRSHGVTAQKPIHVLRKEAGSLVNAVAGIHAASRFLRHSDIGTTAAHYADARQRVVVPVFQAKEAANG